MVNKAVQSNDNILITTYTEANANEIKKKFIEEIGYVSENVTIQTWFSFLIMHGVKTYQSYLTEKKITGMLLVNKQFGLKYVGNRGPVYYNEQDVDKHYFIPEYKIYSDKVSKFICRVNDQCGNSVIDRISKIYDWIFIDEIQDLAGYDLEVIKMLINVCLEAGEAIF